MPMLQDHVFRIDFLEVRVLGGIHEKMNRAGKQRVGHYQVQWRIPHLHDAQPSVKSRLDPFSTRVKYANRQKRFVKRLGNRFQNLGNRFIPQVMLIARISKI